jgi:hypothetical protein
MLRQVSRHFVGQHEILDPRLALINLAKRSAHRAKRELSF